MKLFLLHRDICWAGRELEVSSSVNRTSAEADSDLDLQLGFHFSEFHCYLTHEPVSTDARLCFQIFHQNLHPFTQMHQPLSPAALLPVQKHP